MSMTTSKLSELWWKLFKKPDPRDKCPHVWRPCIAYLHTWKEDKPARICALNCGKWEPLTEIQFFAQFGEQFSSTVQKNREELAAANKKPGIRKTYRSTKSET